MTAQREPQASAGDAMFHWHPEYGGRSVDSVTRELRDEIARDQRAYELALQGAEESEHDALASVVDLERRWSTFDFGWHEADPQQLAERILAFEQAREEREELITWQQFRDDRSVQPAGASGSDWRASMTDEKRRQVANIGAAVVLGLILLVIIIVLISIL